MVAIMVAVGSRKKMKLICKFPSRQQHMVTESKMKKCELKYEIHSPGDQFGLQISKPKFSLGSFKYVEHMLTIYN